MITKNKIRIGMRIQNEMKWLAITDPSYKCKKAVSISGLVMVITTVMLLVTNEVTALMTNHRV